MSILVIGGTSFIGRATVEALLRDGHAITLCNRGETPNPFGDRVQRITCDRRKRPATLMHALRKGWDVVIDFVAFDPEDVDPILTVGASCISHLYVFISSDSAYMAVSPSKFVRHDGGLIEASDADGENDPERASQDEYGADKLATEMALRRWVSQHAACPRVVALRLPDVIGPHENTGRLHKLLHKLLRGRRVGTSINDQPGLGEFLPLSVVAAGDVATAICALVSQGAQTTRHEAQALPEHTPAALPPFSALHVCTDERPTWVELVNLAAAMLREAGCDVGTPQFARERDTGFVSVDVGALDNTAAKAALCGWAPAPLVERMREAVSWWVQTVGAHAQPRPSEDAHFRFNFELAADRTLPPTTSEAASEETKRPRTNTETE